MSKTIRMTYGRQVELRVTGDSSPSPLWRSAEVVLTTEVGRFARTPNFTTIKPNQDPYQVAEWIAGESSGTIGVELLIRE